MGGGPSLDSFRRVKRIAVGGFGARMQLCELNDSDDVLSIKYRRCR